MVLLHRPLRDGQHEALTVRVARHRGVQEATHRPREFREVLAAELGPRQGEAEGVWTPASLVMAREVLARGLLAGRVRGKVAPQGLTSARRLTGDLEAVVSTLDDVYTCGCCGGPLSGGVQLALALGRLRSERVQHCVRCVPQHDLRAQVTRVPVGLARPWLMLRAGAPRRALLLADRAVSEGYAPEHFDAVRGEAHLCVGEVIEARAHLDQALRRRGEVPWLLALLVAAEGVGGFTGSAHRHLERLRGCAPVLETTPAPTLAPAPEPEASDLPITATVEDTLLTALSRLDEGDMSGARRLISAVDFVVGPRTERLLTVDGGPELEGAAAVH